MTDKTKPPPVSWEALQQKTPAHTNAGDNPEEMVFRATSGGDGAALLKWLHREYIEKRDVPGATDAQLRESEAARRLVARLENMAKQGAEMTADRARSKTGS